LTKLKVGFTAGLASSRHPQQLRLAKYHHAFVMPGRSEREAGGRPWVDEGRNVSANLKACDVPLKGTIDVHATGTVDSPRETFLVILRGFKSWPIGS
jgi:hypothetical protein